MAARGCRDITSVHEPDVQAQPPGPRAGRPDPGRDQVEQHFAAAVRALPAPARPIGPRDGHAPVRPATLLSASLCLSLFDAQLASSHLDLAARWLRAEGAGYYTIGSAGHEGNAAVGGGAAADRPGPAALPLGRLLPGQGRAGPGRRSRLRDVLLGLVAAADEPIAGGRHKVFGHPACASSRRPPRSRRTCPGRSGSPSRIGRAAKLGVPSPWPADAIVGGELRRRLGSITPPRPVRSTPPAYCAYQGLPLPLLLVCEDNGLGISVRTPAGWVAAAHAGRAALPYFAADGTDLAAVLRPPLTGRAYVRDHRAPRSCT